jgi:hypothetical protein
MGGRGLEAAIFGGMNSKRTDFGKELRVGRKDRAQVGKDIEG